MSATQFPICEICKQRNSLLYVAFPRNNHGFPYLQVCKVCIADIGSWASELKQLCDDDGNYRWTGEVVDGSRNVLWTEQGGQLYDPENNTLNG